MFDRWKRRNPGEASGAHPSRDVRCSFCEKDQADVQKLIAGPAVFICDECVDVCIDILADDERIQKLARGASSDQKPSEPPKDEAHCALCGHQLSEHDGLPIPSRGVLCGSCLDAVDAVLSQGRPLS